MWPFKQNKTDIEKTVSMLRTNIYEVWFIMIGAIFAMSISCTSLYFMLQKYIVPDPLFYILCGGVVIPILTNMATFVSLWKMRYELKIVYRYFKLGD